ncbi:MAG TPA: MinD/ParA family protein [Anaerolineae bacterium]|nr:MinD/ParA family protein [Anaerolineae bacterium]
MSYIISVHSFRGGTGKSNSTANIASILTRGGGGRRVCIIDTDIQSPGVHVLFGMDEHDMNYTLNDYLWGKCAIDEATYDVTNRLGDDVPDGGQLFLCPSSIKAGEIARVLREGYDVGLLNDGFHDLIDSLNLDVLLIDTHPGINEETLLSIAISDALAIIMRPDNQDFQGTSVTVEVARKLDVPRMTLVVNKVPSVFDIEDLRATIGKTYDCKVAGVIPHSDEMMALSSSDLFTLKFPDHIVTKEYYRIAEALMS